MTYLLPKSTVQAPWVSEQVVKLDRLGSDRDWMPLTNRIGDLHETLPICPALNQLARPR